MLRTNLSTRPFYNVRIVHTLLGLLAILVIAVTAFNVIEYARLSARERSLGADASRAEAEASGLRAQASRLRAQINPKELDAVAAAAREANTVIDQRAFSWTDLFAEFEKTLPPDVRITAVAPRLERDGRFMVSMQVEGRRVEDIDAFIEALESTHTFRDVLPKEEQPNEQGLMEAIVVGEYVRGEHDVTPAALDSAQARGGTR